MNAVVAGLGTALLPKYCCEQALSDGKLVPVLTEWSPLTKFGNLITAVVASDRVGFSRNQAFLKFLKSKFNAASV
jgi:DNA-binding transcriptional LysR family regulator